MAAGTWADSRLALRTDFESIRKPLLLASKCISACGLTSFSDRWKETQNWQTLRLELNPCPQYFTSFSKVQKPKSACVPGSAVNLAYE